MRRSVSLGDTLRANFDSLFESALGSSGGISQAVDRTGHEKRKKSRNDTVRSNGTLQRISMASP